MTVDTSALRIRPAVPDDAGALLGICAPIVERTALQPSRTDGSDSS